MNLRGDWIHCIYEKIVIQQLEAAEDSGVQASEDQGQSRTFFPPPTSYPPPQIDLPRPSPPTCNKKNHSVKFKSNNNKC